MRAAILFAPLRSGESVATRRGTPYVTAFKDRGLMGLEDRRGLEKTGSGELPGRKAGLCGIAPRGLDIRPGAPGEPQSSTSSSCAYIEAISCPTSAPMSSAPLASVHGEGTSPKPTKTHSGPPTLSKSSTNETSAPVRVRVRVRVRARVRVRVRLRVRGQWEGLGSVVSGKG